MTDQEIKNTREYQDIVSMYEDSGFETVWAERMALSDLRRVLA